MRRSLLLLLALAGCTSPDAPNQKSHSLEMPDDEVAVGRPDEAQSEEVPLEPPPPQRLRAPALELPAYDYEARPQTQPPRTRKPVEPGPRLPLGQQPDAHQVGGLGVGPWPNVPLVVYDQQQGLLEAPVSASTDEAQNLWVVTEKALYVLRPGETTFRRFTAAQGLNFGPGKTEAPHITYVTGGAANECFVGYYHSSPKDPPGTVESVRETNKDPLRSTGKLDQVILKADNTLEVRFYDLHNSDSATHWHSRSVRKMLYDHFQHPGNLYVGTNHGVTRVVPGKWRLPATSSEQNNPAKVEREWYADHVHPYVCKGGPCDEDYPVTFYDWFGLHLAADGRLWMGGATTAGAIRYKEDLSTWMKSWRPYNAFDPTFGNDEDEPPVFWPTAPGEPVNIRAISETPDGLVWFASGGAESWRDPHYGLAAWNGKDFTYYNPLSLGAIEKNILELDTLGDGRLILGLANSGLLIWRPGQPKGTRLTSREGLPGDRIGRLYVDRMVNPPALYVPTDKGLAVYRQLP